MAAEAHTLAPLDGLTRRVAGYVAALDYERLPDEVVAKAKALMRDGVGNEVAASAISEPAAAVVDLVREWGGAPQSTVVGYGLKLPTPVAAMCNGMMGHGVELDDAHGTGLIKAGSVLTPSTFAVAELTGADGKRVLAAVVAGYEVAVRIAKAINPAHRRRGYHTTSTVSLMGAAAATAKLLGCDAEQTASALGLAAMQSSGIQAYLDDPCMAKPFGPGKAAFNGTLAGILASRGFTGPKKVLEGSEGFLNAFTEVVDVGELVGGFGDRYAILEVGFKPHAACRYAHGPIDIAQDFHGQDEVRLDDVERIVVHMSALAIRQASKCPCPNLNAAMGSTEFGVALALARGGNGLRDYWDGFKDPAIHRAAEGVVLTTEPAFGVGGREAVIELALKDGRSLSRRVEGPKGEPENPLSPQELEGKFFSMTEMVIDRSRAEEISDAIMHLETQPNAGAIPPLTVVTDAKPALRAA